jgi:hypothetical protein
LTHFKIIHAAEEEMLQPLARRVLPHRVSIYADDVVIFICPEEGDINITMEFFVSLVLHLVSRQIFRKATTYQSGVRNMIYKLFSSIYLVL